MKDESIFYLRSHYPVAQNKNLSAGAERDGWDSVPPFWLGKLKNLPWVILRVKDVLLQGFQSRSER